MASDLHCVFRFIPNIFPTHSSSCFIATLRVATLRVATKLLRRVLDGKFVMTWIAVEKDAVIGKSGKMLWGKFMVDHGNNGNYYNALGRTIIQLNLT